MKRWRRLVFGAAGQELYEEPFVEHDAPPPAPDRSRKPRPRGPALVALPARGRTRPVAPDAGMTPREFVEAFERDFAAAVAEEARKATPLSAIPMWKLNRQSTDRERRYIELRKDVHAQRELEALFGL